MMNKIWLINSAILVFVLFFAIKGCRTWQDAGRLNTSSFKEKGPVVKPIEVANGLCTTSEGAYQVIVDRNLFAPGRHEVKPKPVAIQKAAKTEIRKEEKAKPIQKVEGKKIVLYGVMLFPKYKVAFVNNLDEEKSGSKQKIVKIGEKLGGYKVINILNDRLLLSRKGEQFEVLLYDKNKAKNRMQGALSESREKSSAPLIISTGANESGAGKEQVGKKNSADDGYEVVVTPFGKIRRKKSN
jgi:type II secretory pathway component PulC